MFDGGFGEKNNNVCKEIMNFRSRWKVRTRVADPRLLVEKTMEKKNKKISMIVAGFIGVREFFLRLSICASTTLVAVTRTFEECNNQ